MGELAGVGQVALPQGVQLAPSLPGPHPPPRRAPPATTPPPSPPPPPPLQPPPPHTHTQGTDAFNRQPYHQLRHPMIFYYGHPAVLYINKFRVAGLLDEGLDQFFEQLFETGVDEMSWVGAAAAGVEVGWMWGWRLGQAGIGEFFEQLFKMGVGEMSWVSGVDLEAWGMWEWRLGGLGQPAG